MERERGAALPLICLPVKADAYGHGALPIAKCALGAGVQYLAVATVDEGVQLREGGITAPILLFSQCIPQEMEAASKNGLLPLVGDKEAASLFALNGGKCVFLKIDSGMGRMGCAPCDACKTAEYINSLGLKINGTLTHLAVSDSSAASSIEYTNLQLKKFNAALEEMREVGLDSGIVSAANSGATAGFPASWFDMVRPGILLYGYAPKMYTEIPVKPVMELISQIVCIKKIKGGDSVSYGCTWKAPQDTMIGIIPIGYADGLPRSLSGNFKVSIKGRTFDIVGRICMDQCMVDLGADNFVKRWDNVVIFGGTEGVNNADSIAEKTGTISYEIICGINKRVQRFYL